MLTRAICYRPSVCASVRLSVTRVDQSKTVDVRIMQLSANSPMTLLVNFTAKWKREHIGSGGCRALLLPVHAFALARHSYRLELEIFYTVHISGHVITFDSNVAVCYM